MDIILIFKYVGVAIALIVVCSPLIILAYVIERLFIQLRMTPIKEENFRLRRKISVEINLIFSASLWKGLFFFVTCNVVFRNIHERRMMNRCSLSTQHREREEFETAENPWVFTLLVASFAAWSFERYMCIFSLISLQFPSPSTYVYIISFLLCTIHSAGNMRRRKISFFPRKCAMLTQGFFFAPRVSYLSMLRSCPQSFSAQTPNTVDQKHDRKYIGMKTSMVAKWEWHFRDWASALDDSSSAFLTLPTHTWIQHLHRHPPMLACNPTRWPVLTKRRWGEREGATKKLYGVAEAATDRSSRKGRFLEWNNCAFMLF